MRKPGMCKNGDVEPSKPLKRYFTRMVEIASEVPACSKWMLLWERGAIFECLLVNVGCTSVCVTQRCHSSSSMWFSTWSAWGPEEYSVVMWDRGGARVAASNSQLDLVCGQLLTPRPSLGIIVGEYRLPSTCTRCISDSWAALVTSFCGHRMSRVSVAFTRLACMAGWQSAASGAACWWGTRCCLNQVNSAIKCMPFLKEGSMQEFSSPAFH